MPKPRGAAKSGGRAKGTPNKKTAELQEKVAQSGVTPLEFMLDIMRGDACPKDADPAQKIAFHALRFEAAKAAAPYVHAKLSSVELDANITTKTLAQELAELNAQSDAEGD